MGDLRSGGWSRRAPAVGAAAAAVLLLVVPDGNPEAAGTGDAVRRDLPAAAPPDVPASAIPPTLGSRAVWAAPFSSAPKAVGNGFVGPVNPEEGGDLRFLGVDSDGRTRWSAARNPSCTAFAVTRGKGGRGLVVLLDSDAEADRGLLATRTTAAAFDAADGSRVWGPVEVPGTLVGPGLVFAAIPGSVMSAETGPKVALSAATGATVADERAGDEVLHEHEGTLLVHRKGKLRAVDTATRQELWNSDGLAVPDRFAAESRGPVVGYGPRPVSDSSGVVVLEWRAAAGGDRGYTVNDLRTAAQLAEFTGSGEPRVVAGSGAAVVEAVPEGETERAPHGGSGRVLVGVTTRGPRSLWTRPAGSDAVRPEAVVAGVLYTSEGKDTRAYDMRSGEPLGTGPWPVPAAATDDGSVLLPVPGGGGSGERFAAVPDAD